MYLEKYNLSGKVSFITGGGRGIGLAAADALAEAGARVVISDINEGLLASGQKALAAKDHDAATHLQ
jgi:NAD(P)-dependent dehydrogenase (short-subunit alcohol dehydrogenase family)